MQRYKVLEMLWNIYSRNSRNYFYDSLFIQIECKLYIHFIGNIASASIINKNIHKCVLRGSGGNSLLNTEMSRAPL